MATQVHRSGTMATSKKPGIFAKATFRLIFICFALSLGQMTFGYDTGSFNGVQAIPGFINRYGTCTNGKCALDTNATALANSLAFLGKGLGTMTVGTVIEKVGHRWAMFLMALFNCLGAIVELTSPNLGAFVAGRVITYIAVGYIEVCVPAYQSEICPASMRGFIVASLQLFNNSGGLVAAGVNQAFSTGTTDTAWRVPVALTFIFPVVIVCCLPFVPNSPRWLLYKGRRDEAVQSLRAIRPQSDIDSGMCEAEIEAIQEALGLQAEKAPWTQLFRGTNRRRTFIAICTFCLTQLTGQAFQTQYATTFYKSVGLTDKAFTYNLISSGLSVPAALSGMYLLDFIGRRPVYITGGFMMALFLYLVGGLGGQPNPSTSAINGMVASFMLFNTTYAMSWAPTAHLTTVEISAGSLREKTLAVSSSANVVTAWLVSYTLPYLLNPGYGNLGPRLGFVYGSLCILCGVYAFCCIPESKGRSLEEMDELFQMKIPAWRFAKTTTYGAGHRVTAIENDEQLGEEKFQAPTHVEEMEMDTKA